MPILAAVVTLDPATAPHGPAVASLAAQEGVDVGELQGHRLPVVVESGRPREDEARFDALRAVPGVLAVDLVWADFSDLVEHPSEVVP